MNNNLERRSRVEHLIIGGATRAGTTSLFNYLSHHPEICAASMKETRFFLEKEYPLPRAHYYEEGMAKYAQYFTNCGQEGVWMDATPDYLVSAIAARRIRDALDSVRLIFVLRDPIQRLISWYRFALQNRLLRPGVSFTEYVRRQQELSTEKFETIPQHMRAMEQSRYTQYLPIYYDVFDAADIMLLKTSSLRECPQQVMVDICAFAGLSAAPYVGYDFDVINQSMDLRFPLLQSIQMKVGRQLRMLVHNHRRMRKLFRVLWHGAQPFYYALNQRPQEEVEIEPTLLESLHQFYERDSAFLAALGTAQATFVGSKSLAALSRVGLTEYASSN